MPITLYVDVRNIRDILYIYMHGGEKRGMWV
jgi:hypothetical protein